MSSFTDSLIRLFEGKNSAPGEDLLYDEVQALIQMKRVYNLSVTDMMAGNLGPNMRVEPKLTSMISKLNKILMFL